MRKPDSHPLLQQTPLTVNPFIDLPKPPTLPPTYTSLPSTLPPSTLNAAPAPSNPDLPAYVVSSSGNYAAHPDTIVAQNRGLLEQLERQRNEGQKAVEKWEEDIRQRELAEKRRKAPGWLDRNERLLEPERKGRQKEEVKNLMDGVPAQGVGTAEGSGMAKQDKRVDDLGAAMDRAFGRSEMG